MRTYEELVKALKYHAGQCFAKEDDSTEVCAECAYEISGDGNKYECLAGLCNQAVEKIEQQTKLICKMIEQFPKTTGVDEETGHSYIDIDKIRLVKEGKKIVGWYRPDNEHGGEPYEDGYHDGWMDAKRFYKVEQNDE